MQGFLNSAQAERELAMGFCMCWLVPGWGWILLSLAYLTQTLTLTQPRRETKLLSNDSRLGESVREALLTHTHGTELITMVMQ
ncbi:hypothetical protein J3E68DRAFT_394104 [Trichoderma sp. SZMC 28012]